MADGDSTEPRGDRRQTQQQDLLAPRAFKVEGLEQVRDQLGLNTTFPILIVGGILGRKNSRINDGGSAWKKKALDTVKGVAC